MQNQLKQLIFVKMFIMNFDNLVDEILDHPNAEEVVEKVRDELEKEKKARLDFRDWLTDDIKAEFINGEIVMHSPVKRGHLEVSENLFRLLSIYVLMNKLGRVSIEKALIGLKRNDYEPDLVYWNNEQAKDFNQETMVHPVPSLVVEILSKSTKARDKGIKFKDYAAHGIPEYWIIDYQQQTLEQYFLADDSARAYTLLHELSKQDHLKSIIIEGFEIPVAAIFEEQENLKALKTLVK